MEEKEGYKDIAEVNSNSKSISRMKIARLIVAGAVTTLSIGGLLKASAGVTLRKPIKNNLANIKDANLITSPESTKTVTQSDKVENQNHNNGGYYGGGYGRGDNHDNGGYYGGGYGRGYK